MVITGTGFMATNLKRFYPTAVLWKSGPVPITDVLIHTAAELRDESKMVEANVALTWKLLNENYKTFIHIGSSSELVNNCIHAATKIGGTALCHAMALQYDKRIIVLRPFSLYGPYDREDKLMATLYRAWKTGTPVDLYPEAVHDWTHIDDFITFLSNYHHLTYGPHNVGTGIQTRNEEVYKYFCDVVGSRIKVNWIKNKFRVNDTKYWKCPDPLPKFIPLKEGLRRYVEHKETGA